MLPQSGAVVCHMQAGEATMQAPPSQASSRNFPFMTPSSPGAAQRSALDLCEPCAGIQQHWRKAPGHAELVQGTHHREDRGNGQASFTRYRCDRCGAAWEYENNKANQHAGWSLLAH